MDPKGPSEEVSGGDQTLSPLEKQKMGIREENAKYRESLSERGKQATDMLRDAGYIEFATDPNSTIGEEVAETSMLGYGELWENVPNEVHISIHTAETNIAQAESWLATHSDEEYAEQNDKVRLRLSVYKAMQEATKLFPKDETK